MSVINQMLKDLAVRSKPLSNPEVLLSGLTTPPQDNFRKDILYKFLFLIILLGLITTSLFFLRFNFFQIPEQLSRHTNLLPNATPNKILDRNINKKDKNNFTLEPSNLENTSLVSNNETTSLRLLLSHPALYQLSQKDNELTVLLENTQLTKELANLDTTNSSLQKINITNDNGNLKIVLSLNAGTVLNNLTVNEKEKMSEIDIDFFDPSKNKTFLHDFTQNKIAENPVTIKKISNESTIDNEYHHAMGFSAQADNKEAIHLLTALLQKKPNYIPARKSLAAFLIKEGNLFDAQKVLETGLEQHPFYPPYIQLKSQILVDLNKIHEALSLLEVSPPPLEENPEYHAFMAALYQRVNKSALAEKLYLKLLRLQSHNSLWWIGLGIAKESLGKNAEALESYYKAKETNSLTPELMSFSQTRINLLTEQINNQPP